MYTCDNRIRGCSKVFDRKYGLNIHLRSCIHKKVLKRKSLFNFATTANGKDDRGSIAFLEMGDELPQPDNFTTDIPDENSGTDEDLVPLHEIRKCLGEDLSIPSKCTTVIEDVMLSLAHLTRISGRDSITNLIKLLHHSEFSNKTFQEKCKTAKDCIQFEDHMIKAKISDQGFTSSVIRDEASGIECNVYMRSPIEFLRKQLNRSSNENCIFNSDFKNRNREFSNPMEARLGQQAAPAVIDNILSHINTDAMWKYEAEDDETSFVGFLQLYSDKSKTTLKASAFQFYPLHITLLNFEDGLRRQCITDGLSLIGFLPVSFFRIQNGQQIRIGIDRMKRLEMVHQCISYILAELKEAAYKGFAVEDMNGVRRRCHVCIAAYCSDLPEGKDLTSVKNGNSSLRNCHRCLATTDTFNRYTTANSRIGKESTRLIRRAMHLRKGFEVKQAAEVLHNHSLVEHISFLYDFPFSGITPALDYHSIFKFEPLHNFHLGVSRDLKRCMSERLRSEEHTSCAISTKTGNRRVSTFKSLRMTILSGINRMLAHIQQKAPAKGLRVDFSTSSKAIFGNGLFGDDGKLVGMLEAKDYRSVDLISPFIGMMIDRCCDEVGKAPTTHLFVKYVELMHMSMSYGSHSPLWTREKIHLLENMIKAFKREALQLYGKYHPSMLCTEKFHQLDHITEDIETMGGIRSGDAGLYEHEHVCIKQASRSGSQKFITIMKETVSSYVKEKYHISRRKDHMARNISEPIVRRGAKQNAREHDSAYLVGSGQKFTVSDLEHGRKIVRQLRIAKQAMDEEKIKELEHLMCSMDGTVLEMLQDIGEEGCRILAREFTDKLSNGSIVVCSRNQNIPIRKVASGYVSGMHAPSSSDHDTERNEICVVPSTSRLMQRIVSCRNFGGSRTLKQDSVLIQASEFSSSAKLDLWVGKTLGLFHIPSESNSHHDKRGSEVTEFAFIQFYEVVSLKDEIDRALG